MAFQRFMIAPFNQNSGLQKNVKPWLIPDQAFSELNNAYVFRERVRKRFGSTWMNPAGTQLQSRFRVDVDTTDAAGAASGTAPGAEFNAGQMFSIGGDIFTVNATGTPANLLYAPQLVGTTDSNGDLTGTLNGTAIVGQAFVVDADTYTVAVPAGALTPSGGAPGSGTLVIATGAFTLTGVGADIDVYFNTGASGTYNTTTGAYTFTSSYATTDVYFYPALPVMGLLTYESANVNNETLIGFDTQFAYSYSSTGWDRISAEATAGAATWTGADYQLFWGATWISDPQTKIFFVTNFNQNEPNFMRYYNGTQWENFRPAVSTYAAGPPVIAGITLEAARILVVFKNRLIALNTWERVTVDGAMYNTYNYPNRARYAQVGSPLDANAWRQDTPGLGNAVDCATTEALITVEFIRDRLICYFERSTWELVYTGNQAYPFVWQQINTELGVESTFSIIPFDNVALGIGNVGIHSCSGTNVQRIDNLIPNEVYKIHNSGNGVFRVYGIRDYFAEVVYWTFPAETQSDSTPFPNRVLVFNYKTGTWAFNDDSITAFGYYYPQVGISWDSTDVTWDDSISWDSGFLQSQTQTIIMGNQQGYTSLLNIDVPVNASVLQITDISYSSSGTTITCYNHNLSIGEYVYFEGIVGATTSALNDTILEVLATTQNTFLVITPATLSNDYEGNGTLSRVSNIRITTKEYNFFADQNRNAYVSQINFMVDRTDSGQIFVDTYASTNPESLITAGGDAPGGTGSLIGVSVLETYPYPSVPFEENATRLWHPIYFQSEGEVVQFSMYMTDDMMRDTDIRTQDFVLHAFIIYAMPTSSRLQ